MITIGVLFFIYQIFFGLLSFYHQNVNKSNPEDLSEFDIKLWLDNSLLATISNTFAFLFRINGIVFLIYFGYQTAWYNAAVLYVFTLILMAITNTFIRLRFGMTIPALISFIVLPIVGTWIWFIEP